MYYLVKINKNIHQSSQPVTLNVHFYNHINGRGKGSQFIFITDDLLLISL